MKFLNKTIWSASSAILAYGLLVSAAASATEVPVYVGTLQVTKVNAACKADGLQVGMTAATVVRIKVRPSNNAGGGIQFLVGSAAHNYMLGRGKPLKTGQSQGTFSATGFSSQVGVYTYSVPFTMTISPATVTDATTKINLTAELGNLIGIDGCTASVKFAGTKK